MLLGVKVWRSLRMRLTAVFTVTFVVPVDASNMTTEAL